MKNKGFTLAELLAVILLLGVISFIIVPNVVNNIEDSKEKLYADQISQIKNSAKQYTKEELNAIPDEGSCYVLEIESLITSGYLQAKDKKNGHYIIKNPKTNEALTGHISIKFDYQFNQYVYEYEENNLCANQASLYSAIDSTFLNNITTTKCKSGSNSDSMLVTKVGTNKYKYEYISDNTTCQ